jgi:ribonuclease P protein component
MIAIAVPKRQFKAAVKRNRIKRLVREAHRTQKHTLQTQLEQKGQNMAFLIKFTGRRLPTQEETSRAVRKILHRLAEKV